MSVRSPLRPTPADAEMTNHGRGPRRWIVAVVLVAAIAVVAALAWHAGDGGRSPSSVSTPTTAITTTSTTSVHQPVTADRSAMWPFPGTAPFGTPDEAAQTFATRFLRFTNPIVGSFQQGDLRSGEVAIRPTTTGPVTTIFVRQLSSEAGWSVVGAATEDIELTTPHVLDAITSPVRLHGRALAYEGNVSVDVIADGDVGAIGSGFVTGGGDIMRPFDGKVAFDTPGAPYGVLVLYTTSAEDGHVWQATAVRVAFGSTDVDATSCGGYRPARPRPTAEQMEVKAYFTCDADGEARIFPVYRLAPRSPGVLQAALRVLVAGPSPTEKAAAVSSWFSPATVGLLRSVTIADGHAVVDFGDLRPVLPNASTSAGSARLLGELDATVFQFRTVTSVEYRIDGSCEAFSEWLQFGGCEPRTRGASTD